MLVELKFFCHFSLEFCNLGVYVFVSFVMPFREVTFELLHLVVETLVWALIPYFLKDFGVYMVCGPDVLEFEALWALSFFLGLGRIGMWMWSEAFGGRWMTFAWGYTLIHLLMAHTESSLALIL